MSMPFEEKLYEAKLVKRYKRFFADAVLVDSGETVTSHCPNTGSMKSCGDAGDVILLSHHTDPKRKLKYTWQFTKTKDGFIGVNTHLPNKIVRWFIENGELDLELGVVEEVKPEVKYGSQNSRIDLRITSSGGRLSYIEIKNVTLYEDKNLDDRNLGGCLYFPDAVSTRGQKHLEELTELKNNNPKTRAIMLYFVNRAEGKVLKLADHIDPKYAELASQAKKAGVEFYAARFQYSKQTIAFKGMVDISI